MMSFAFYKKIILVNALTVTAYSDLNFFIGVAYLSKKVKTRVSDYLILT